MFYGLKSTFFHAACICYSNEDMAEHFMKDHIALLDSAVNSALNSTCGLFAGFTPLYFAVLKGNEKMIQMLLDHGADPAALSTEGDAPLRKADYFRTNELYMPDFDDRLFLPIRQLWLFPLSYCLPARQARDSQSLP